MNEFGDTADIEARAINVSSPDDPTEQTEEFLELANGCLCCSIKDAGAAAIEKLMRRRGAFDYILLETTGLADPGPIASMFWHNEEYATGLADIVLDGVVCVVDAVFGKKQMEEDHADDKLMIGESLRQIAGCDVIILNKIDLADSKVLGEMEQMIQNINPAAPVYKTIKGDIDLKHILGISAYKLPSSILINENPHIHSANCDHDHEATPNHYEIRGISSLQVSCPALDQSRLDKLDEWVRSVLWENRIPGSTTTDSEVRVLRCKGAFTSTTGIHYVLQGVQSMYEISELDAAAADSLGVPEVGKIVLIGKGLDDNIRRSLDSVLS